MTARVPTLQRAGGCCVSHPYGVACVAALIHLSLTLAVARADSSPFLTDADLDLYLTDSRARVISPGGTVTFYAPGIKEVCVKGEALPVVATGRDLVAVRMPEGIHDVEVVRQAPQEGEQAQSFKAARAADVATVEEFTRRQADLKPGGQIVVKNGTYLNCQVAVTAGGTAEAPIVIRPQTPGGVVFMAPTRIRITGSHVVFRGFRFSHCSNRTLQIDGGDHNRITQCQFFQCGSSHSTFGHVVNVNWNSDHNRIDHCYFTGSKSMSIGQSAGVYPEPGSGRRVGVHNRFDRNIFRDIGRIWLNGQEAIQVGQGQAPLLQPRALIELNVFDNASGDHEIISLKSSNNVVRHNLFVNCIGSFYFRNGNENRVESNVLINNTNGLVVRGLRHRILNNLIMDMSDYGIKVQTGREGDDRYGAVRDGLIAHNTIVNCGLAGFYTAAPPGPEGAAFPEGNRIVNNIFTGVRGTLIDRGDTSHAQIANNLFHAAGEAKIGHKGGDAIVADPQLTGSGAMVRPEQGSPAIDAAERLTDVTEDAWENPRPMGRGPDLGSVELKADGEFSTSLRFPPIPKRSKFCLDAYAAEVVAAYDPAAPLADWRPSGAAEVVDGAIKLRDGALACTKQLPDDFIFEWEYRPEAFGSKSLVSFAAATPEAGYWLGFGGADREGRPLGVITLAKGGRERAVLQAPDTVYYRMNVISTWPGNTIKLPMKEPIPDVWYRCRLMKRGSRIRMEMTNLSIRENGRPVSPSGVKSNTRRPGTTPVLVWQDADGLFGPALAGHGLRIEQSGTGYWRNMRIRQARYVADAKPGAPADVSARAIGANRVSLTWRPSTLVPGSLRYTVYRATEKGFEPSKQNQIATGIPELRYEDLGLARETTFFYKIKAVSPFGLDSDTASIEATTGRDGPVYLVVNAADRTALQAPMALDDDGKTGMRFLWAPGQKSSRDSVPEKGRATYAFSVERTGRYSIWALVLTPDGAKDSFYLSLDGARFSSWGTGLHPTWEWAKITREPISLQAGRHTIALTYRESLSKLAKIMVTDDVAFEP